MFRDVGNSLSIDVSDVHPCAGAGEGLGDGQADSGSACRD
jgi:hypothetical protein